MPEGRGDGQKTNGFISGAQLRHIHNQREQIKELQRLQDQPKENPKDWLERPDLVKILDQRDRERESTRLHKLENDKPEDSIKPEEQRSQE